MKFKLGDEVSAYKLGETTDGWVIPKRFSGKIDSIDGDVVWIDGIPFHIKSIRKIKKIPSIFKNYKKGDCVNVFDEQGKYEGTGTITDIESTASKALYFEVKRNNDLLGVLISPTRLRKAKC